MAIAKKPMHRAGKSDRIGDHIKQLQAAIRGRFPEAQFHLAPVAESSWPGLWVRCNAGSISDVTDPLEDVQEAFFQRERMDVHVIVLNMESLN